MAAASRGGSAVAALLRGSQRICSHCARSSRRPSIALSVRRGFADSALTATAAATAAVPPQGATPTETSSTTTSPTTVPSFRRYQYKIKSSLILTRAPLLTCEPTPFESAFYLYQKRLDERLAVPFRHQFYFRKDTAAELDWRLKVRERHGVAAKDIGRYNPRGRVAWNDELLVGSPTSAPQTVVEKLLADAQMRVSEDGEEIAAEERVEVERPAPRRTEADEKGDVRRLDRALDRTLYLVVKKGEEGEWRFPEGEVLADEALHETAARVLAESAGVNMNTWIVGRVPVAHLIKEHGFAEGEDPRAAPEKMGEKIFFLKGRIMAGQVDLAGNTQGVTDFKWLTKEELNGTLLPKYYISVRNMFEHR